MNSILALVLGLSVLGATTKIEQTPYQPFALKEIQEQETSLEEEDIRSAQKKLNDLGIYNGEIDGEFDGETIDAIKVFQKEWRLRITGELDQQTRDSLKRAHQSHEFREERLKSFMYD